MYGQLFPPLFRQQQMQLEVPCELALRLPEFHVPLDNPSDRLSGSTSQPEGITKNQKPHASPTPRGCSLFHDLFIFNVERWRLRHWRKPGCFNSSIFQAATDPGIAGIHYVVSTR